MKRNGAGKFTVMGAMSRDVGRVLLALLRRTLHVPGHPVAALMWLSAVVCSGSITGRDLFRRSAGGSGPGLVGRPDARGAGGAAMG